MNNTRGFRTCQYVYVARLYKLSWKQTISVVSTRCNGHNTTCLFVLISFHVIQRQFTHVILEIKKRRAQENLSTVANAASLCFFKKTIHNSKSISPFNLILILFKQFKSCFALVHFLSVRMGYFRTQ